MRIWNNSIRIEVARLAHNSPVVSVVWMEGDGGIVSLGLDGIVSKWTRTVGDKPNSQYCITLSRYRARTIGNGLSLWILVSTEGIWKRVCASRTRPTV